MNSKRTPHEPLCVSDEPPIYESISSNYSNCSSLSSASTVTRFTEVFCNTGIIFVNSFF